MWTLIMMSGGVGVTAVHATMWRYQGRDTAAPGTGPFLAAVCKWGSLQMAPTPYLGSEQSGQRYLMMVSVWVMSIATRDYDGRGQQTASPMFTAIMSGGVGIIGRELSLSCWVVQI